MAMDGIREWCVHRGLCLFVWYLLLCIQNTNEWFIANNILLRLYDADFDLFGYSMWDDWAWCRKSVCPRDFSKREGRLIEQRRIAQRMDIRPTPRGRLLGKGIDKQNAPLLHYYSFTLFYMSQVYIVAESNLCRFLLGRFSIKRGQLRVFWCGVQLFQ
jgi:hypothetical protein